MMRLGGGSDDCKVGVQGSNPRNYNKLLKVFVACAVYSELLFVLIFPCCLNAIEELETPGI